MTNLYNLSKNELLKELWASDFKIRGILRHSVNLADAREKIHQYLNTLERHYFSIYSDKKFQKIHIVERNNAKECIRVLKNIIRTENEKLTGFSALNKLFKLANSNQNTLEKISEGFIVELIHLFRGINGKSGITDSVFILEGTDEEASQKRTEKLDEYSQYIYKRISRFRSGLAPEMEDKRKNLQQKIINYFKATESDWFDYKWQMRHIIKDMKTLTSLVDLNEEEKAGLETAKKYNIPFQITPYYLSLFNEKGLDSKDRAVRTLVLPSKKYCKNVHENSQKHKDMDFMGEKSTSPIEGITRRYPHILILKPFNSCPQICVYCQRNWEIKDIADSKFSYTILNNALEWIHNNKNITEVLVTGGDPLCLGNKQIGDILEKLSKFDHIERIRIGTRTLVTLPYRINDSFIELLNKYNVPGRREVCIITHFEHFTEITSDVIDAVSKIRKAGVSIYNQQVFTYYNSFRYETAYLRKMLKLSGIDPYYTFNTKGKDETIDFRVPIARIEQERKEEARFLPGIVRTDEPVFNLPKLGKSHLRAWQDHEPIMILDSGERIYRFFPWESKVTMVEDYLYKDVPIYNYLKRLQSDGENIEEYGSIWYYF
ncbi:MAG: KamA family radical SAM protein [Bacteroidetes bacterium RIFOXYA12_FULL_35_11]|nr:MAG: KamA family radical SAM protein [Bacteroidetes bacterium GWF2_35_48]OFY77737.1 MAG: KamA family radical SAM protein [Bacteroidetes bacterium RIFOXYA12_FULL_35_11]OFY98411.1 MAG: KamA family radical SAM protein [Bacteroidetes bacterium RIFOXYC12_FULL_35_7]HBX51915.1 KamA family radical SAM protein [Bacteroidales bacterium]